MPAWRIFLMKWNGQFANGWILKKQGATGLVYSIYLKGRHKFDIVEKEKGWTGVSSDAGPIDTKLANLLKQTDLTLFISSHLQNFGTETVPICTPTLIPMTGMLPIAQLIQ